MDRTIYSDGILVDASDLNNTENTLSYHDLKRHVDSTNSGVVSGLVVSVNGINNRQIDISTGYGYAPNGELVELLTTQVSVSLSNITAAGITNLVCLVYTETQSKLKPHETNGTTALTRADRALRVRVFTQAEYNALSLTDSNLANDSKDRCLIVASIIDPGAPTGLSAGVITLPPTFQTLKFSSTPINVTGVTVIQVSTTTAEGIGTLTYTTAPNLQWQAPGSGAPGVAVSITTDGDYLLTGGDGSTITVHVISSSLPSLNKTDTLTIKKLYGPVVARFTAADVEHRSLLGSGTPTPTNPHGTTLEDIGESFINELIVHQDLMHVNGIARSVSSAGTMLVTVDSAPLPDRLLISQPTRVQRISVAEWMP